MTIETHDSIPDSLCDRVFALLSACDSEFVPPLSHRMSTSQRNLTPNSESIGENDVSEYFEQMRYQRLIVALGRDAERDRGLLAFLSYIPSYNLPVDAHDEETSYITTVCTDPRHRCKGIARQLYLQAEATARTTEMSIRTWSTNASQMHLLAKLGYEEVARIPDDRGEGVDTVYLVKGIMC